MNQRSDFDHVLISWFDDGPTVMPDRVIDAVAERIGRQRQRSAWRLRRRLAMPNYMRLVAALAAAVVVAVIGYNLLPRGSIGGPNPTAVPTPSRAASAVPVIDMTDGSKQAGRYRSFVSTMAGGTVNVVYDLPAGWSGVAGDWLASPDGLAAPGGLGIAFLGPAGIFSDPCHWDAAGTGTWPQPADVAVGPTVLDLATALAEKTTYGMTQPVAVTVGASTGLRLQLTMPSDLDPSTCDKPLVDSAGRLFVFGPSSADGVNLYAQGPRNIWDLWILDVRGTRIVIVVQQFAGTSAATRDAANAIIASMRLDR